MENSNWSNSVYLPDSDEVTNFQVKPEEYLPHKYRAEVLQSSRLFHVLDTVIDRGEIVGILLLLFVVGLTMFAAKFGN